MRSGSRRATALLPIIVVLAGCAAGEAPSVVAAPAQQAPPAGDPVGNEAIVGTWRVRSFTDQAGKPMPNFAKPEGYITYSNNHVFTVITGDDRPRPVAGKPPADAEKARLYDTVIANAGRYEFKGLRLPDGRVSGTAYHYLESAQNPALVDPRNPQVRHITIDRGKLTILIPAGGAPPIFVMMSFDGE